MRHVTTLLLGLLLVTASLGAQSFYDTESINSIEITFVEENWDAILDGFYSAGDEERLVATAVINGVRYDSVGVRYKGNSTYSRTRTKNPFNIKLDEIIDDQELDGYGTLKLANVYNDPTFVRETLGYEIARKYMPASLANYMKVTVNGRYLGLYTSVQSVDKYFLGTSFKSNGNAFFKGELIGTTPQVVKIWGYFGLDSSAYSGYYEMKSDEGWSVLLDFLGVLNNENERIEEVLNVDRHLWMLAYDNLLVNLDSPINFAHNYYLYQDNAGQFNPIIWDLNESFGVFSRLLSGGNLSITQMQQLDPFLNANSQDFPIISKILDNPRYRRMYVAHMKTMIEENFSNGWYLERGGVIQDAIAAEVEADPNKFYTYADFLSNLTTSTSGGGGGGGVGGRSVVGIGELMGPRASWLMSQPAFQATAPSLSNPASELVNAASVNLTLRVEGASDVRVNYRSRLTERFVAVEMHDDGLHGDGGAGDGLYGATLEVIPRTTLEYYFYAENSEAGAFSPARAANEFYELEIPGVVDGLVINEFLASNDVGPVDQDGEHDDWVELYNNSDVAISLAGYHLTDDGNDLTQWAFPDTSIAPGGYLVIWADEDDDQEGLHASFKLSASGETILLLDPTGEVVDEISYAAQVTDVSTGRFPNGTGEFTSMPSTIGAENIMESSGVQSGSLVNEDAGLNLRVVQDQGSAHSFSFRLSTATAVELRVYDALGNEVAMVVSEFLAAGDHRVQWHATSGLPSGFYHYLLSTERSAHSGRLLLVE